MDETKTHTIGEAAELTGVSQDTLRYYEKIGLLAPVARAENGHRRYDWVDLAWVRFFTILRATGMPIRAMLTFAELEREGDPTIDERRALLEEHRGEVARKVEELERSLGAIDAKIAHYRDVSKTCIYPLEAAAPDAETKAEKV
jgi:DNA-binding transcriptional MerR regulator